MGAAVRGFAGRLVRGAFQRPDVLERVVDERRDVLVTERLLACASDPAHAENRVLAQDPQLVRDHRLLPRDSVDDLRHRERSGA